MPRYRTQTQHFVITLDGTPQQLVEGLTGINPIDVTDVHLQAGVANVNPIYIGGSSTLTSTNYGVRIPAPVANEPSPPYPWPTEDGVANLWILGTSTEKVHVLVNRNWYNKAAAEATS